MNFGDPWKKQPEVLSFTNSKQFATTHAPRPQSTLNFQKNTIQPCNIYHPRHSASNFQADLTPIYERNESIKSSQQNSFHLAPKQQFQDAVNVLDISQQLLLSSKECTSRKQLGSGGVCPAHQKNQDIICLVDRCKICAHCALFGEHRDHNFKSEAQFLEEVNTQTSKLSELQEIQKTLLNSSYLEEGWQKLRQQCRVKEKQLLDELSLEFSKLLQKIQTARKEIETSIREQSQNVQITIEVQSELSRKDVQANKAFDQWIRQGRRIVDQMKQNFDSSLFEKSYSQYDTFAWLQGDRIVGEEKQKVQRLWYGIKRGIQDMKLNLNQHTLQNFSSSLFFASQIQFPSDIDTSITSLDDLHKHLGITKTQSNEKEGDNQFLDFRQFKFRNSQCLQTINEPGRTSIGLFDKAQRMSAKCFAKKAGMSTSKKENKPTSTNHFSNTTFLQRQKSDSKLETSIYSLKTKMKVVNSPKIPRSKPDPMRIIVEYERNQQTTYLNLSDCNLSEDSLVYFLQRANKVRPPIEVNLQKNNLSSGGFTKLLPYLISCAKINLSYCGIGQACLQSLLRTKALKRLEECNLTGNDINTKKNRTKLQQLKRTGIKIICN